MMQVPGAKYLKWANERLEKVIDKDKIEDKVRIVPARFCYMQCINENWYLPGDNTLIIEDGTSRGRTPRRYCKVVFCHRLKSFVVFEYSVFDHYVL